MNRDPFPSALFDKNRFFEDEPNIGYQAQRKNWGNTAQQTFHQGKLGDVWNRYQGGLGSAVEAGNIPSAGWGDYLKNYDWDKAYYNAPRSHRAEGLAENYNPVTRYILY